MAIQRKHDELIAGGARIHLPPPRKLAPVPESEPPLEASIERIARALAESQAEARADIVRAIAVNEEIALALQALCKPACLTGNWTMTVTGRDQLGRISEVVVKPVKP